MIATMTFRQRLIALSTFAVLIATLTMTAFFTSTETALGYGECTPTAPRTFHRIARTPRYVRFAWVRPKERCDQRVETYTVVAHKKNDSTQTMTLTVKAPRRRAAVFVQNLFGRGQYKAYVYGTLEDGTVTPNSRVINFIVRK